MFTIERRPQIYLGSAAFSRCRGISLDAPVIGRAESSICDSKSAPGLGSAGCGLVGTGLAVLFPEQRWIGLMLIGIGIVVFVFDFQFERGHIETGERRLGKIIGAKHLLILVFFGIASTGAWEG
jgi:hypothetical protein